MIDLPETPEADIRRLVEQQKKAHIVEGPMTAERRIDLIDRCIAILVDNKEAIVDALNADFGNRSPEGSLASDVGMTIAALKHNKKNVRKWMKASKRKSMFPWDFWEPARALNISRLAVSAMLCRGISRSICALARWVQFSQPVTAPSSNRQNLPRRARF